MEYFFVFLLILSIIFIFFSGKIVGKIAKYLNKNVLFKSEYEEGQKLITDTVTFSTKISPSGIIRELEEHIPASDVIPALKAALYESSRDEDYIGYAFGNKVMGDSFSAVVLFTCDEKTNCIFKFLTYSENDGRIAYLSEMIKLRKRVENAFKSADPSVRISCSNGNHELQVERRTDNE